jgi:hypothetical protein
MRPRKTIKGKIAALTLGKQDWDRVSVASIQAELDGLVGDKHRGYSRIAFDGDKEPEGAVRRNERQWTAMSVEEIAQIQTNMDLVETLTCLDMSVNLCFEGIADFSQLPKGTKFIFPSGAKLVNVEYNPPCTGQGEVLAKKFATKTGVPLTRTSFPVAAIGLRGLLGVVDVAGEINVGDEVLVEIWDESCQINKPRVKS